MLAVAVQLREVRPLGNAARRASTAVPQPEAQPDWTGTGLRQGQRPAAAAASASGFDSDGEGRWREPGAGETPPEV